MVSPSTTSWQEEEADYSSTVWLHQVSPTLSRSRSTPCRTSLNVPRWTAYRRYRRMILLLLRKSWSRLHHSQYQVYPLESVSLPSSSNNEWKADRSSDQTYVWPPVHPIRPIVSPIPISQPPLVPTGPAPNPNDINSKRSRSDCPIPLPLPCPIIQLDPVINPLFPSRRREGGCIGGLWEIPFRYRRRYIPGDF